MNDLLVIMFSALFVNNIVLMQFLGMCPFIGVSRKTNAALGMGFAVMFVMALASVFTWAIFRLMLEPMGIEFLRIVVFIFVIASLVQLVELFIKAKSEKLYKSLGIYLPLITTNCAVLGVAFLNINKDYSFLGSLVHGISAGVGFMLALLLMSGIREKLDVDNVPKPFRGIPIAFIVAAFMSMAFMGFASLLG